jgi:hypothetical protein
VKVNFMWNFRWKFHFGNNALTNQLPSTSLPIQSFVLRIDAFNVAWTLTRSFSKENIIQETEACDASSRHATCLPMKSFSIPFISIPIIFNSSSKSSVHLFRGLPFFLFYLHSVTHCLLFGIFIRACLVVISLVNEYKKSLYWFRDRTYIFLHNFLRIYIIHDHSSMYIFVRRG